jgi:hypothetical protein
MAGVEGRIIQRARLFGIVYRLALEGEDGNSGRRRSSMQRRSFVGMIAILWSWPAPGQNRTKTETKSSAPTLATACQKYLGKKVNIIGPLEPPPAGLQARYVNWRFVKRGARGRYVEEGSWASVPYGYEQKLAAIIAIQLSERQRNGPWTDILGNRHEANEMGPSFDFVVEFEHGVFAMTSSWLETATANFRLVQGPATSQ